MGIVLSCYERVREWELSRDVTKVWENGNIVPWRHESVREWELSCDVTKVWENGNIVPWRHEGVREREFSCHVTREWEKGNCPVTSRRCERMAILSRDVTKLWENGNCPVTSRRRFRFAHAQYYFRFGTRWRQRLQNVNICLQTKFRDDISQSTAEIWLPPVSNTNVRHIGLILPLSISINHRHRHVIQQQFAKLHRNRATRVYAHRSTNTSYHRRRSRLSCRRRSCLKWTVTWRYVGPVTAFIQETPQDWTVYTELSR